VHEVHLALTTTVADRTAEVLRQRILALTPGFRPGDRLWPVGLAADLGVSATPVREALERLAADGLVEVVPRRGTYVARLSTDDLDDLASVRAGLETLAFRFRGGKLSAEELAALGECLDSCEQAIATDNNANYRASEAQFHRLLVAAGRSPRLLALCEMLLNQAQIAELYYAWQPDDMRASLAEHRRLLGALSQGDLTRSEAELAEHWRHSRARVREQFGDFLRNDHQSAPSSDGVATQRPTADNTR
jgi:DNA-binding GntR family transcriptional regulator